MNKGAWSIVLLAWLLSACAPVPPDKSSGHLRPAEVVAPETIPELVKGAPVLPPPSPIPQTETYTVVVSDVPAKELLFALARDARLNVDIHPQIAGTVTMNAVDQTLEEILRRLTHQVDLRYELRDGTLVILPDTPYLRTYRVDYVNLVRESETALTISNQLATGAGDMGGGGGSGGGNGSSESSVTVRNTTDNRFWERLEKNIIDILAETTRREKATEKAAETPVGGPEAGVSAGGIPGLESLPFVGKAPAQPASEKEQDRVSREPGVDVIVNPEAGIVAVRATARQHETVEAYLAQVQDSVRRQVLIEATIVEVLLSQDYQAGIDWETFQNIGFEFIQASPAFSETNVSTEPFFTATYLDGDLSATIQLLDEFGDTRVLSSPKLMALNNQTALLKVVDNEVYFTIETDTQVNVNAPSLTTFDTTPNIVPVGLVMSVTPQIDGRDVVTLSVRPTISRVIDTVLDPNPALAEAGTTSEIPVIRIRELESVMMVNSGQIAVLGGLMQDAHQSVDSGIPLLSDIPYLGEPFTYKSRDYQKSELVVFLRPTVMRQPSLDGQLRDFRPYLEQEYQKRPRSRREGLGEIFDGLFPP